MIDRKDSHVLFADGFEATHDELNLVASHSRVCTLSPLVAALCWTMYWMMGELPEYAADQRIVAVDCRALLLVLLAADPAALFCS